MDRRTFLKSTTAAAAVTTAAGAAHAGADMVAPAITTSRHELRVSAPSAPYLRDAAELFSREIEAASDGRIVLHLVDAAGLAIGPPGSGQIDGAFGHLSELCAAPELSLFTGLPGSMALAPESLMTWLHAGAGSMFLEEAVASFDLTAMTVGHSGAGTGLWSSRVLNSLDDIATARVEAIGLGLGVARALVAASSSSASTHSSAHVLEATAQPMLAYHGLSDDCRQILYRDGLHRQGFATSFVLSLAAWHKLSAGDQLLLQSFALAAAHHDLATTSVNSRMVAPAVMNSLPVDVRTLRPEISTAIEQVAARHVHDVMVQNDTTDRAFQAYASFFEAINDVPLPGPEKSSTQALS